MTRFLFNSAWKSQGRPTSRPLASIEPMQLTLSYIAKALGGEVSNGQVRAPGPGHSAKDRSLCVAINDAGDDIVVKSWADDDEIACKDYVRQKIGLPAWQPNRRKNGNSRSLDDEIGAALSGAS